MKFSEKLKQNRNRKEGFSKSKCLDVRIWQFNDFV